MSLRVLAREPRVWLTASFGIAVFVTALSDIPEVVPGGHIAGIVLSQLAFSYVGAYVFNKVVVELPRADALRGYYIAAEPNLSRMMAMPPTLLQAFIFGDYDHPLAETATESEIRASIDRSFAHTPNRRVIDALVDSVRFFDQYYSGLLPLFSLFEPNVSRAIASLQSAPVFRSIKNLQDRPDLTRHETVRDRLAWELHDIQTRNAELKSAVSHSPHYPASSDPGRDSDLRRRFSDREARRRPGSSATVARTVAKIRRARPAGSYSAD